jgi:transposase
VSALTLLKVASRSASAGTTRLRIDSEEFVQGLGRRFRAKSFAGPGVEGEADAEQLNRLRTQHVALTEGITLAEAFVAMIRAGQPERFDPWLAQARDCALPALRNFARKLDSDYDAVRAAMTSPWSTGQVEGQINRLKMIKRQMFGRASFDLLNRRFILAA